MRAKIKAAKYQVKNELIVFTLLDLETNKEQSYCWPSIQYLESIGIEASFVEDMQLIKHCEDMIGKIINFEVQGEEIRFKPKIDVEKQKQVEKDIEEAEKQVIDFSNDIINASREIMGLEGAEEEID